MAYKGKFKPTNTKKYIGDPDKVIYRSLWERKCMVMFDTNSSFLSWSSEPIALPYLSPVDGKFHRYFVDFYIKVKTKNGKIKEYLVEVKPHKQTKEPKLSTTPRTNKPTRRFLNEAKTYAINLAKWKAADEFCKERNWQFVKWTEKDCGFF